MLQPLTFYDLCFLLNSHSNNWLFFYGSSSAHNLCIRILSVCEYKGLSVRGVFYCAVYCQQTDRPMKYFHWYHHSCSASVTKMIMDYPWSSYCKELKSQWLSHLDECYICPASLTQHLLNESSASRNHWVNSHPIHTYNILSANQMPVETSGDQAPNQPVPGWTLNHWTSKMI